MLTETEEIPFIEVGPQKSMEASPSVMACIPNVAAPSLALRACKEPSLRACEKSAASPRSVPFRAVFLASPETEPETPQTDGTCQPIIPKRFQGNS
ncbi:MAG TPA: hypothetical protein VMF69_22675 [Gemmataceae bacterium]|nr:hypothetical protein [Gemmataceae bacterium]